MTTPKIAVICEVSCPYCKKPIIVTKETRVIRPAEPAEKEETYKAEKSTQTQLPHEED
jgi:hypothetical protein